MQFDGRVPGGDFRLERVLYPPCWRRYWQLGNERFDVIPYGILVHYIRSDQTGIVGRQSDGLLNLTLTATSINMEEPLPHDRIGLSMHYPDWNPW